MHVNLKLYLQISSAFHLLSQNLLHSFHLVQCSLHQKFIMYLQDQTGLHLLCAQTVIDNTETNTQEILVMDSMQSTTTSDSKKGVTYVSLMEKNLEVLTAALR